MWIRGYIGGIRLRVGLEQKLAMAILLNLGHGAGIPGTTLAFLTRPSTAITEIKSANGRDYRWLSKQYHSDTTSLPLEIGAQKFTRLKEYVLSSSPAVGVKPPYQVKHLSLSARKKYRVWLTHTRFFGFYGVRSNAYIFGLL